MFKRVMVAVVGIPFLLLVLIWAPDWAPMLLVAAMCAIGAWELLHAAAGGRAGLMMPLTVLMAALVPLDVYLADGAAMGPLLPMAALAFVTLLFLWSVLRHGRDGAPSFGDVTAALFAGLAFPLMLSCLLRLRLMPVVGKALVFVPLCISFGSDTFALFAGMAFGKHKLAPRVSPKKTVEGAVGGLVGGILGTALIRWLGDVTVGEALCTWAQVPLLGIVGSAISQLGDLSFSVIKREFGVKDYGKLLPGHGGILDRFDSVTFVCPWVWLLLALGG